MEFTIFFLIRSNTEKDGQEKNFSGVNKSYAKVGQLKRLTKDNFTEIANN